MFYKLDLKKAPQCPFASLRWNTYLSEPFPVSCGGLFQSVAHHSNQEVDQQNAVCDNKDQEEQLDEKKRLKQGE